MGQQTIPKRVVFTGVRKAEYIGAGEIEALNDNEVMVQTLYSGISAGTELTWFRGRNPNLYKKWDPETRLFLKAEAPTQNYPQATGYENIGKVIAKGSRVRTLDVGEVVFSYWNHVSAYKMEERELFKLPKGVEPKHGVFIALGGVAFNGILDARIVPGESVAIFGMGVIGQIAVQLAEIAGAKTVIAVDLESRRLELAAQSGADVLINPRACDDVALKIRGLTGNRGADVVIEVSGAYPALQEAIRTACFQGRVIVVSFYTGEAKGLNLGEEFHVNRIRLISSQASGVNPELHPRWNDERKLQAFLGLFGKLKLSHLITHEFKVEACQMAFDLIDKHPQEAMQVVFVY